MIDSSPFLLILYLCGIAGFVFAAGDFFGLSDMYSFLILFFVSIMTTGLWFLYFRYNRLFTILTAVFITLTCVVIMPQIFTLSGSLKLMVMEQRSSAAVRIDMFLVICLTFLLTFLIFALEFVLRMHSVFLALGVALLLMILIFGKTVSISDLLLILIFEVGFAVSNMTEKRSGKNSMAVTQKSKINMLSSLTAAAVAAAALVPAFIVEGNAEPQLYDLADTADSYIKDAIAKLTGTKNGDVINNGVVGRGNLYRSGKNQLSIYLNKAPESKIYLRGYTGKLYSDSNWSDAFDTSYGDLISSDYYSIQTGQFRESFMNELIYNFYLVYEDIYESLPNSFYYLISNSSDVISEMYFMIAKSTSLNSSYFTAERRGGKIYFETTPEQQERGYIFNDLATDIYISNLTNTDSDNVYIPYYSRDSKARIHSNPKNFADGYYRNKFLPVYEINASEQWKYGGIYAEFEQVYKEWSSREYLEYTSETPRLEEYCKKTPLTSLDEITTYILVTLNNQATYTTTPGNVPYNKDVIDYFLFENKKGYCVHFASAAALMYRMYGIPARYVTGYVAQPSDFSNDSQYEDYYSTVLTDYAAHAWVEIFLDDYGWVPVEVTPAEDGSMVASYPGYDMNKARTIMNEKGWRFRNDAIIDSVESDDSEAAEEETEDHFAVTMIILIASAVLISIAAIVIRRKIILKKVGSMNCRRLFDRLIRSVHFSGMLKEYNGSEKDFSEKLSECCASVSKEQSDRLIAIMLAVNYSESSETGEERDLVEQICRLAANDLYKKTFVLKRPVFKFLKAYN